MIAKEMLAQIQHAPLADRIQFIKIILQFLKDGVKSSIFHKPHQKAFKVQKFHLGQEIHCNRDKIYAENLFEDKTLCLL